MRALSREDHTCEARMVFICSATKLAEALAKSEYGRYLFDVLSQDDATAGELGGPFLANTREERP